jgi:hypothetical protein
MEKLHTLAITLSVHDLTDGKKTLLQNVHFVKLTDEQKDGNKEKKMAPFPVYLDWKTGTMLKNIYKDRYIAPSQGTATDDVMRTDSPFA